MRSVLIIVAENMLKPPHQKELPDNMTIVHVAFWHVYYTCYKSCVMDAAVCLI